MHLYGHHTFCIGENVENFKWLLLWSLWANVAQILYGASLGWGNERLLKWSQSIDQDMIKTFKNPLLQNQISPGALSLHKSSGTGDLPKLLKWWSYVDVWPFYGKVKFASPCICMGLGKMLRIHILDISSIIQLNRNLMMSIRALMRHKIAKLADRKSKMATIAAILKINFRRLFSNLRSLWAEQNGHQS